ncbi:hypothetical protein [Streptomyces sp. NPDC051214]|uniref:hypothetical protein n=1 Tax=Streptomyces sp. NPDC051214 TaxID=3155282 RepID=UPI00343893BD
MSTEARRAPVPPRPTAPPPPPGPPASMPPPAPSARFPDLSPSPADPEPSDSDDDQDSLLGDLLAPFDRVRLPRPSTSPDETRPAAGQTDEPDDLAARDAARSRLARSTRSSSEPDSADDAADELRRGADEAETQDSPPPPPASARFPDAPPPSATTPARTADPAPDPAQPPPPPATPPHVGASDTEEYRLRPLPDAPPPSATSGTPAHTADPAPDLAQPPPPPAAPPHVGAADAAGAQHTAEYRLRPLPDTPPPSATTGTPAHAADPAPASDTPPPHIGAPDTAQERHAADYRLRPLPDVTPPSAAHTADPAPDLAQPPPRIGAPHTAQERRAVEYRLRPPMPSVAPPDAATAGISGQPSRPATDPVAAPISPPPPAPSPRTAAARRAVGAVDLTPGPGAGRPFVSFARPAMYDDSTTRLRPVRTWAQPRVTAAAACVVLGLGLIGGAATGSWLTGGSEGTATTRTTYAAAGELWHSVPVDQLFPATIKGEGAGPGGADRTWTRVAVAPDAHCKSAFDPLLRKALAPAGCLRLLRATYTDATRSHVTTVGLLFTKADADAMRSLRTRFTEEGLDRRPDLMPRPYAAKGTPAADFGDAQRASWTVSVLPDAPVVAFSVSGFADGRTLTEPEPAEEAMKTSATSAPAQAGLGHEAQGIADRVERRLRKTIAATEKSS